MTTMKRRRTSLPAIMLQEEYTGCVPFLQLIYRTSSSSFDFHQKKKGFSSRRNRVDSCSSFSLSFTGNEEKEEMPLLSCHEDKVVFIYFSFKEEDIRLATKQESSSFFLSSAGDKKKKSCQSSFPFAYLFFFCFSSKEEITRLPTENEAALLSFRQSLATKKKKELQIHIFFCFSSKEE